MIKEKTKYDTAFKMMVITLLKKGEFASIEEARKKFRIGGTMTIHKWMKKYGDESLLPKLNYRTLEKELEIANVSDPQFYSLITKTLASQL